MMAGHEVTVEERDGQWSANYWFESTCGHGDTPPEALRDLADKLETQEADDDA